MSAMKRCSRPADSEPSGENVSPAGTDTLSASTIDVAASVWVSSAFASTRVAISVCRRPVPRLASAAVDDEMSTGVTVRRVAGPTSGLRNT